MLIRVAAVVFQDVKHSFPAPFDFKGFCQEIPCYSWARFLHNLTFLSYKFQWPFTILFLMFNCKVSRRISFLTLVCFTFWRPLSTQKTSLSPGFEFFFFYDFPEDIFHVLAMTSRWSQDGQNNDRVPARQLARALVSPLEEMACVFQCMSWLQSP